MNRLELIKQAALRAKAKKLNTTVEELEFQEAWKTSDKRRAQAKVNAKRQTKLTKQVKKAAHQAAGHLECFKPENMHYSDRETQDYLRGTSYFENYQSMKNDWD